MLKGIAIKQFERRETVCEVKVSILRRSVFKLTRAKTMLKSPQRIGIAPLRAQFRARAVLQGGVVRPYDVRKIRRHPRVAQCRGQELVRVFEAAADLGHHIAVTADVQVR